MSGMNTVERGNGQLISVYIQTPAEMKLITLSKTSGDVNRLDLSKNPEIVLEIAKLATPTHNGVICQAQVQ